MSARRNHSVPPAVVSAPGNGAQPTNADRVEPTLVPTASLHPAPWNPRLIRDPRFEQLCRSLADDPAFLWRRPILATVTGEVMAGNMRLRAAQHLGWLEVPAILDDIPERLARERALKDNNQWGEWQEDDLAALVYDLGQQGGDLSLLGFDDKELTRLLDSVGALGEGDDAIPEPPAEPITRPGDLWLLGPHRLLCGDSTRPEDVARLMGGQRASVLMTDPPYGVGYDEIVESRENQKRGGWERIANDGVADDLGGLLAAAFGNARDLALQDDAAWFCWHPPGANSAVFRSALEDAGVHVHKQIIWVKPHFVFGRWEYHWQHEPCWYGWREGQHPEFYGDRSESTVWAVEHEGGIKTRNGPAMASLGLGEHPTQKPPELWERAIRNHSRSAQGVFDPFAGSGPAVTAAQRLGRVAYVMDAEPKFCDVIVQRWAHLTGDTARREAAP